MSESEFVAHEPCPKCGSRDALARYSDGHAYCFAFGCEHYEPAEGEASTSRRHRMADANLISGGEFKSIAKRDITEETARKFGYRYAEFNGKKAQVADYRDQQGNIVAQHLRFPNKDFVWLGDSKNVQLWGQHLWGQGGKKVVVTEGEIDAMSVSQVQGNKWPVVSIPSGVQNAKKALMRNLEWLETFEEVILMFDMDEPGQGAVEQCASLFTPGKCKVATLPLKDANDCLVDGKGEEVIRAIWNAKVFRPDGIVQGTELWEVVCQEDAFVSMPYPWESLNTITRGARLGELVVLTAGSGIGKSAIVREVAYDLILKGETIGMLMLEETTKRTALGLMGLAANHPLHLDREGITEATMKDAFDVTLGTGRVFLYEHFGSTDVDNLLSRIRYLAKGCGCRWIFLDHLSIVVSGHATEGDERKLIDEIMTKLRTLVQELNIGMFVVSHLRRPTGDKGHEQGAETSLSQLRGSHAIAQLADMVIGLERDQQGDKPHITALRILKNRFSGETGVACYLAYDRETGRLHECDPDFEEEKEVVGYGSPY